MSGVLNRFVNSVTPFNTPLRPHSLLFYVCRLASSRASDVSASQGFITNDEPITIFRLELERLQFMLHFPEEVAFQLTATEYQLFYSIQPMDFVRYVSCDLTSVPMMENPSPVKNLIKRLSEVSSWITHIIISSPNHDDRRAALLSIIRMIDTCWNIGNFNGAVEILMGLKSEKLRPFWLTLSKEERSRFDQLCEMLLPSNQASASGTYLEAVQRALKMPQCRIIPFFGIFLRDLYAIVNDMPNVVIMGNEGKKEKLEFLNDRNGEDHFSSRIGVGGLLNADKIQLVAVVLENIGVFHKHARKIMTQADDYVTPNTNSESDEVRGYEPVQPVKGGAHGISLIPLDTALFDLDVIQRMHHGMTVINNDLASGRSVLCMMTLDASCSILSWRKVHYAGDSHDKEGIVSRSSNDKQNTPVQDAVSSVPSPTPSPRPACAAAANLEDGSLDLLYVKSVERIDTYDIDVETIYRKHSSEDNAVPVYCWVVTYGSHISENEFLYFIAPQETAHYWLSGLTGVVKHLHQQMKQPDKRVLWLKKLYLQLYSEAEVSTSTSTDDGKSVGGPRPLDALSAFGGQVEKYRSLAETMSIKTQATESPTMESSGPKSKLMQMTMAVTRRMRGSSRDLSRSQSPQPLPLSPNKPRNMSIRSQASIHSGTIGLSSPGLYLKPRSGAALSESGDVDSICTTRSRSPTASSYGARSLGARSTRSWNHTGNLNEFLFTPRSRTTTNSSFTGRSIGGRSLKSWKSKGRDTPNSGSVSSSGFISFNTPIGKEYHEKPLSFVEFIELYRLFSARLRKDIKDIFNDCVTTFGSNTHASKRDKEKHSPRLQSRLSSASITANSVTTDFIPDDVLTRNRVIMQRFTEKQQKIYKALAMASVNSMVDMQQTPCLSPAMLKQFCAAYQMEQIDDNYANKLIQEHEPDPYCRSKQQMTFEGFVRFLNDPRNFAFVPEETEIECDTFNQPLSHYYISSSHNTYLTGHQLKGESSAEMYRQILLTGCRCVELDCWDGDDGFPQIFHGHTLTSKIFLRQVLDVIKKSAFTTSSFPVILSLENHCSLQQQAKMAQMIQNYLGDKLVTNFLFESDFIDNPKLPTPYQLQYRILIKNKKMVFEPSSGLVDRTCSKNVLRDFPRDQSKISYESSIYEDGEDDDLDEFLDDEPDEEEDRTDNDNADSDKRLGKQLEICKGDSSPNIQENRRDGRNTVSNYDTLGDTSPVNGQQYLTPKQPFRRRAIAAGPLAPELSDLVIYLQAVKFKGFPKPAEDDVRNDVDGGHQLTKTPTKTRSNLTLAPNTPNTRRAKLGSSDTSLKISTDSLSASSATQRPNVNASCYQVTSLNENAARKLTRKHRSKCIAYSRNHVVRTYPGGMRIDSSNFNPTQFWAYGFQMVALNFQTSDVPMAVNAAMFEQTGNCGFVLKPKVLWDENHPAYDRYNPVCKDPSCYSAMILTLNVISGQHVFPKQPIGSPYLEVEIIGMPCDNAKYKSKAEHRNAVNPTWNFFSVFRITCVDLAFLRIAVCDASNGRCCAQRVVPVKCLRPGYRHLPLRDLSNHSLDQSMLFLFSKFEQEEIIYLFDDDNEYPPNYEQELSWQILKADMGAEIKPLPVHKKQIFILKITGLNPDDAPTIVRADSSSTVRNVIQSALAKSGKNGDAAEDYVLIEERVKCVGSNKSFDTPETPDHANQRVLPSNEPIMDAVACWNGFTMGFIIKKKNVDPGSRAWISSLIKSGSSQPPLSGNAGSSSSHYEQRTYEAGTHVKSHSSTNIYEKSSEAGRHSEDMDGSNGLHSRARSMGETFLLCIHNVSADQPYAILRACITSTASDIIRQVFLKSAPDINYNDYVLVEEIAESGHFSSKQVQLPSSMGRTSCRVLSPDENLWKAQSKWKSAGRFVLENRKQTVNQALEKVRSLIKQMELAQLRATGVNQNVS
uniref:Phosphoinositide phospholipase C n=1 Tax=Syphacia muris TaxID=451379 RepID=A0A158R571_9BILA